MVKVADLIRQIFAKKFVRLQGMKQGSSLTQRRADAGNIADSYNLLFTAK